MKKRNTKDKFWGKIKPEENGCVIWTGKINGSGYGCYFYENKYRLAHRLSYEWINGPIPEGLLVLHRCDNPPCVNPEHLWLGTQKDNSQDASKKGRLKRPTGEDWKEKYGHLPWNRVPRERQWAFLYPERVPRGDKHYKKIHPELGVRGERVNTAKLTETLVRQIRSEYIPWKISTVFLAKKYNISKGQAHRIVTGESWRHTLDNKAGKEQEGEI